MYGSKSASDTFYLSNSTIVGSGFVGSQLTLHHSLSDNSVLNTNVSNNIEVGVLTVGDAATKQFATINDFISGVDKLVVGPNQGTTTITVSGADSVLTTGLGSKITLVGTIINTKDLTTI
jgi:hypothetical protein